MATKTNTKINGKDYFRISRTIDGKRKYFYGTSKSNAEAKYDAYLKQRLVEQKKKDIATFGERAQEYVTDVLSVSNKYAKGTIDQYVSKYKNYIKGSSLSKKVLSEITASDIQRFYNSLDVSAQTMKGVHKFMNAFCKWSLLVGYSENFMAAVEIPKKTNNSRHNDIVIWEDKEIREIIRSMNHCESPSARHRQFFLVHVLLYTGMRISEALALKYADFDDDVVHVDRQFYLGEEKPPKYNSKRTIPLHKKLKSALKAHKQWHEAEMKEKGYATDYVFTTETGQLYHAASVRKALKRFYAKRGIPYKHIHAYRATFCTNLCRCDVPLEVASKLMGHKSLTVTAEHYALVRPDTQQDAIAKLRFNI